MLFELTRIQCAVCSDVSFLSLPLLKVLAPGLGRCLRRKVPSVQHLDLSCIPGHEGRDWGRIHGGGWTKSLRVTERLGEGLGGTMHENTLHLKIPQRHLMLCSLV